MSVTYKSNRNTFGNQLKLIVMHICVCVTQCESRYYVSMGSVHFM